MGREVEAGRVLKARRLEADTARAAAGWSSGRCSAPSGAASAVKPDTADLTAPPPADGRRPTANGSRVAGEAVPVTSTDAGTVQDRPSRRETGPITFTGIRKSAKLREIALLHPPMNFTAVSSPLKPKLCLSANADRFDPTDLRVIGLPSRFIHGTVQHPESRSAISVLNFRAAWGHSHARSSARTCSMPCSWPESADAMAPRSCLRW